MLISRGMHAEPIHKFLQTAIKLPPFPIVKRFDYQKLFMHMFFASILAVLGYFAWSAIQEILLNKNIWAFVCIVR